MDVQIFGVKKSKETRKALRFFSERRVKTHFVDLTKREASKGELTRFVQKFGVDALVDRDSKRFAQLGLGASHLTDTRWVEKLVDEPRPPRMPLVRWQNRLTVGDGEAEWIEWVKG